MAWFGTYEFVGFGRGRGAGESNAVGTPADGGTGGQVKRQGIPVPIRNESDSLKKKVEALEEVVQRQKVEIGELKSQVFIQLIAIERLQSQFKDLKNKMTTFRDSRASQQEESNVKLAADAVPSPNGRQQEGMLMLVVATDVPTPGNSGSRREGAVPVPLSPPDNQQEESMLESIEFLADLPPIPSSSLEAAIHRNHEELCVNVTEDTSTDSSGHTNSTAPDSVLHSDQDQDDYGINAYGQEEREVEELQDCIFCAKIFNNEESLYRHIKAHIDERPVSSQQSDKVLSSRRNTAADGGFSVQMISYLNDNAMV